MEPATRPAHFFVKDPPPCRPSDLINLAARRLLLLYNKDLVAEKIQHRLRCGISFATYIIVLRYFFLSSLFSATKILLWKNFCNIDNIAKNIKMRDGEGRDVSRRRDKSRVSLSGALRAHGA